MDWRDLLPEHVAKRQSVWELNQRILRAWAAGATQAAIARALQLSRQRVNQRKLRAQRNPTPPIEDYLSEAAEQFRRAVIIRRELEKPPRPFRPASRPFGKRHVIVEGNLLVLGDLVAERRRVA